MTNTTFMKQAISDAFDQDMDLYADDIVASGVVNIRQSTTITVANKIAESVGTDFYNKSDQAVKDELDSTSSSGSIIFSIIAIIVGGVCAYYIFVYSANAETGGMASMGNSRSTSISSSRSSSISSFRPSDYLSSNSNIHLAVPS
jgi:hypothetical protein